MIMDIATLSAMSIALAVVLIVILKCFALSSANDDPQLMRKLIKALPIVVFFGPIIEELVFRGPIIYFAWPPLVVVTSFLFAAVHTQVSWTKRMLIHMPGGMIFGLWALSHADAGWDTLIVCAAAHAVDNTILMSLALLARAVKRAKTQPLFEAARREQTPERRERAAFKNMVLRLRKSNRQDVADTLDRVHQLLEN